MFTLKLFQHFKQNVAYWKFEWIAYALLPAATGLPHTDTSDSFASFERSLSKIREWIRQRKSEISKESKQEKSDSIRKK